MASEITKLRIFVASPSDVSEERDRAKNVIEDLNKVLCDKLDLHCQFVGWEDVPPGVGTDPQAVINEHINENYDIFIGIMWSRIGSETPRAISGSVEEFESAYKKLANSDKSIKLMFYFKEGPISPTSIDPSQLKAVQNFRSSFGSSKGVLYKTFQTVGEFEKLLNLHLTDALNDWGKSWGIRPTQSKEIAARPNDDIDQSNRHYLDYQNKNAVAEPIFEEGLFDLIEIGDSNAQLLVQVVERIGDIFSRSASIVGEAVNEINGPLSNNETEIRRARKVSDKITESLILSSNLLTSELPLFSEYCEKFFDSSSKSLILLRTFPGITSDTILNTWSTVQFLESNMEEFRKNSLMVRDVIQSFPRITKNFDKSRIRFIASVDGLNQELATGLNYVHEIKLGLRKLLLNSQSPRDFH